MWNLAKSRRAFLADQQMKNDRSFWFYAFKAMGAEEILNDPRYQKTIFWQPHRSNCPELEQVLDELISDSPQRWTALLRNLFVGRTLDGDPNAEAWNRGRVGVVELTLQYTNILTDYMNAFDHFLFGFRDVLTKIDLLAPDAQERVDKLNASSYVDVWESLDAAQSKMADVTQIVGSVTVGLGLHPQRSAETHAFSVSACERWIIGHEVAHHLLGHTAGADRSDARATRTLIADLLYAAGADSLLQHLNPSQRQEVHADCLSLLLITRGVDSDPDVQQLYGAIAGSFISLLAATHARDDWLHDEQSSHPPMWTRMAILDKLIRHISGHLPAVEVERGFHAHPLGLLIQMNVFAGGALRHWLHRTDPGEYEEVKILDLVSALIDSEVEARKQFPALNFHP